MLDWLFKVKPKEKPKAVPATVSKTAFSVEPVLGLTTQEPLEVPIKKETVKEEKMKIDIGRPRILSIEKAKDHDELITVGDGAGASLQLLLHRESSYQIGDWYTYPDFFKLEAIEEIPYRKMYKEHQLKQKYTDVTPLTMAIKSRLGDVKCIYCHSVAKLKAQLCLKCGTFLCTECSPTVSDCPSQGCK